MPAEGALRDGGEAGFHLIETMRCEPGAGLLRRAAHLARLEASARALGFAFDARAVERSLRPLEDARETLRVRLRLERDGTCEVEARPFAPLAAGTVWTLAVASTRLSTGDALLRHKTSRRAAHEAARAEFPAGEADEVLLLNERGELCEGAISTLFVETEGGLLATPPLACGLLAGVLRGELLAAGRAVETVLRPEDLRAGGRIFVGNSLRGLIEAAVLPQKGR